MNNVINSFRGPHYFLSNFYMVPVTYDGQTFLCNEAAFQAQKCESKKDREKFCNLTASEAKRLGRSVKLRKDWESVKITIMYDIVYAKFTQHQDLTNRLIGTGDAYLEEGNTWNDTTWGTVNGVGENHLGKILMEVREKLRVEKNSVKELVVLERSSGEYNGYVLYNNQYVSLFDSSPECLFAAIKKYTDKGYTVKCLDKSNTADFMMGSVALKSFYTETKTVIWRYDTTSPFVIGGRIRKPIATRINIADYEVKTLDKGFMGIIIDKGPAKGVYELTSGGLVGDTVEMVNTDINACDDISVMRAQIKEASRIRDNAAVFVTNQEFGLLTNEVEHE